MTPVMTPLPSRPGRTLACGFVANYRADAIIDSDPFSSYVLFMQRDFCVTSHISRCLTQHAHTRPASLHLRRNESFSEPINHAYSARTLTGINNCLAYEKF